VAPRTNFANYYFPFSPSISFVISPTNANYYDE
jgi:hypothetical protein